VDVRGLRADEAVREVELFLDQAFRNGDPGVLVLHGHGTGALKQAVREYLEDSPYVRMYRPGESHEGGDGVTVVGLRVDE
jgi:DNA mismatch repair protein MutS2